MVATWDCKNSWRSGSPIFKYFAVNHPNMEDIVLEKFKHALSGHGLSIDDIDEDGLVYITKEDINLKVSLDNVRRDYERDQDEKIITNFAQSIADFTMEGMPDSWEGVKDNIVVNLFPAGFNFESMIHLPITDTFDKVYTHFDGERHSYISYKDLEEWDVPIEELDNQAEENMDELSEGATLAFEDIEGHALGHIQTAYESLKSAFLLSSAMRSKIGEVLGVPFYAVIPVRDLCYVFGQADLEFFSTALGQLVVDEYKSSGYPITTELLTFTEEEVTVIGEYPLE